jgi:hypothetical protein
MRNGDFTAAWELNDVLRATAVIPGGTDIPRHLQSIWCGSPVDDRRVLVRCYHGLGDTIQFVRYIPRLRARAAQVLLWAQPALIPLLSGLPGLDRLLPLHDGDPGVARDVDVEIMELPYLFRTTIASVPHRVPYLSVDPLPVARGHGPAVGLVWRAGDWANHRSIPFQLLGPLLAAPVTWYVLQGGAGLEERPAGFGTAAGTDDVLEAARVIASLDLLITIDSMPAHLAGALAAPVWTLLAADADWRWMIGRDDTPWYPTMRLFRQERAGEWGPVIERVAHELHGFIRGTHARGTRPLPRPGASTRTGER